MSIPNVLCAAVASVPKSTKVRSTGDAITRHARPRIETRAYRNNIRWTRDVELSLGRKKKEKTKRNERARREGRQKEGKRKKKMTIIIFRSIEEIHPLRLEMKEKVFSIFFSSTRPKVERTLFSIPSSSAAAAIIERFPSIIDAAFHDDWGATGNPNHFVFLCFFLLTNDATRML